MKNFLIGWVINAAALVATSYVVPGFKVDGFGAALITALVIGLVNGTLGLLLKVVTFPLAILTLGIVWLVVNALMLLLANKLVSGFHLSGFWAAFFGAIVLSVVNTILRSFFAD
jgi:putative membrane protein